MDTFTVGNRIKRRATSQLANSESVALVFESRQFTYSELDERAERLAAGLRAAGMRKGDRACVILYNRPEWFDIFFALAKLGGTMVPVNYYLKPPEVRYIVEDSGATWVICEDRLWELADRVRDDLDPGVHFISVGERQEGALALEELTRQGTLEEVGADVREDDVLLLQYTSGTTGFPKGATHTHGTVLWNSYHQILDFHVTRDDVYLIMPALCWAAGLHDLALATVWAGGRCVLQPSGNFDPQNFFEIVAAERVTKTLLVPTVLKRVLAAPEFGHYDLSSLSMVISGGEPVPVTAIEEFSRRLPSCDLLQVYGLSEFPSLMLFLDGAHGIEKAGSTGRACSIAEVRLVDDAGRDVKPGEVGEIICRSPACMVGYYGKAEATEKTLAGGWLHTGDLGYIDEEGYVFVKGREKDMIITGGLNVYPAEVERVIAQHPGVLEAAVIGVPDEKWGEIGKAIVVVRPDCQVMEAELVEQLKRELADFKIPRLFQCQTDPLPRTTSGKIQKFLLRG